MAEKPSNSNKLPLKNDNKNAKGKKLKESASHMHNNTRPNSRNIHREGASKSNTPKSSREGTPKLVTPKSSRGNTPKPSTPKPLPKYQYSKEKLIKYRKSPLANQIPICLEKYRDILPDIILDEPIKDLNIQVKDAQTGEITVIKIADAINPEHWYKHIHPSHRDDSRGNSPLTLSAPPRPVDRKPRNNDGDSLFKRKEPAREDEDGGGIVLGPQRKSFDTGCHVSKQESGRGNGRRIGSGRIAMRHDSFDDERGGGGGGARRELPQLEQLRKQARDRRTGNGFNDRGYSNRRDYDFHDDRNERDYGERRYENSRHYRSDYRGNGGRHESMGEEPEWFSAGPTSQTDTIELRGFEESPRQSSSVDRDVEHHHDVGHEAVCENHGHSDSDRQSVHEPAVEGNGSGETIGSNDCEATDNEADQAPVPSDDVTSQQPALQPLPTDQDTQQNVVTGLNQLDFNNLFTLENIPGLSSLISGDTVSQVSGAGGGSRFSQWFNRQAAATPTTDSRGTNSRRSSFAEEFSYLHDLINGTKSPVTSPEPDDSTPAIGRVNHAMQMSPVDRRATPSSHPAILQLLGGAQQGQGRPPVNMPQGAMNVSDVEASLKSLLMASNRAGAEQQAALPQHAALPVSSLSGKQVLTASELEAQLLGRDSRDVTSDRDTQYDNNTHATSQSINAHVPTSLLPSHSQPASFNQYSNASYDGIASSSAHNMATSSAALHVGRVRTVAEIEAAVKQQPAMTSSLSGQQQGDMRAFNRLLGMVKANQQPQADDATAQARQNNNESPASTAPVPVVTSLKQALAQPMDETAFNQLPLYQQQAILQHQAAKQLNMKYLQQQQQQQSVLKQVISQASTVASHQTPLIMKSPALFTQPPPPLSNLQATSPFLTTPRAPSPLMFGSQPPTHLTAPSPIHAGSQMAPRSPSPVDLQNRAQQIMQSALIKKQLEGQKQRFLQKQQQQQESFHGEFSQQHSFPLALDAKSSVMTSATSSSSNMTSTPASTNHATLNPAFTPTSVIRKMANDKLDERERNADDVSAETSADAPVMKLMSDPAASITSGSAASHQPRESRATTSISFVQDSVSDESGIAMQSDSSGNISISVPPPPRVPNNTPATPAARTQTSDAQQASPSGEQLAGETPPVPATGSHHQHSLTTTAASKAPRPLIGQGNMNHMTQQHQHLAHLQHLLATTQQALHATQTVPPMSSSQHAQQLQLGRPIVKGGHGAAASSQLAVNALSPPAFRAAEQQRLPGQPMPASLPQAPAVALQRPIVGPGSKLGAGGAGGGASAGQLGSDSVRLAEQARLTQLMAYHKARQEQQQLGPTYTARLGATSLGATPLAAQQAAVANALLLQQRAAMMQLPHHQGLHPQQVAALQAAQQLQQQRQFAYPPAALSHTAATSSHGRGIHGQGASQRPLSPQQQLLAASLQAKQGGATSSGGRSSGDSGAPGGGNLFKFFGQDLLKQQLTTMPPVPAPAHGQSILTVEEIERRQQQQVSTMTSVPAPANGQSILTVEEIERRQQQQTVTN